MNPDVRIRHLVATWPEDAPRGAVTAFCRKHRVSRTWFYKVRAATRAAGPMAAMEMKSTRPVDSPARTSPAMEALLLQTRAFLAGSGFDAGPLSVIARLERQGVAPPSRTTVWRVFTRAGVVVPEPRKRPRSSYKRFTYPEPNGCWQIDATQWLLADNTRVAIFQLIDDHSRLALASLAAAGETSAAAIQVVTTALERHGVPRKFLSDNGAAFNPSRRGRRGALVDYLTSLGVEPITGKPYKPTTQGKNERFHQTLHRFLHAMPPAADLAMLQDQVDVFDAYYNTERVHQGLPGKMTPQEAWDAAPKAAPPVPPVPAPAAAGTFTHLTRRVDASGAATALGTHFMMGKEHAGTDVQVLHNNATIMFFDGHGTEIITHPIPPRGTIYVGNNKPRGFMAGYTRPETQR